MDTNKHETERSADRRVREFLLPDSELKAAILPMPLAAKPILGVLFVQL